jgi:hypothetical protein
MNKYWILDIGYWILEPTVPVKVKPDSLKPPLGYKGKDKAL